MKIVFFSKDGCCGVSSNMAAISIVGILMKNMKILAMENHWSQAGLADYYWQGYNANIIKEGEVHYLEHGFLDNLVSYFASRTNARRSDFLTVEVLQNFLYYMPQNAYQRDVFDYEFCTNVIPKLNFLETIYPYIFLDTKNYTMNSKLILDAADLVIVNLPQNLKDIHSFFQIYSSLQEKSIFLISKYHFDSSSNLNQIINEYQINPKNFYRITYNEQFEHALYRGRVIQFIFDNFNAKRGTVNYTFIQVLKSVVERIEQILIKDQGKEYSIHEKANTSIERLSTIS